MNDNIQPSKDTEKAQPKQPDSTNESVSSENKPDPRQTAAIEAHLARQRAAMGFT